MAKALKVFIALTIAVICFASVSEAKSRRYQINVDGQLGYLDLAAVKNEKECGGEMTFFLSRDGELIEESGEIKDGCTTTIHHDGSKHEFTSEVYFEVEINDVEYTFHGYMGKTWTVIAGWYRETGKELIGPWYGESGVPK